MSDYIPNPDSSLQDWMDNFVNYVKPRLIDFGFDPADLTAIEAHLGNWKTTRVSQQEAKANYAALTEAKDDQRVEMVSTTREFVRRVQASPTVTDQDRVAMGITPRGSENQTASMPIVTHPVGHANGGQSLQHTIRFTDQELDGVSKAKPQGAYGCEIYMKIGDAPAGPSEMTYVGTATRTPYIVHHAEADAGKLAYYRCRWITNRQEVGPWSDIFSGTIAA